MRSRWLLACVALSSAISAEVQTSRNADGTVQFGPKGCVALSKSESGTCVLTTKCAGVDTSAFEFAFLCVDDKGTEVKHTFGDGGFLDAEEYDTEVACATCAAPDGVEVVQAKAKSKQRTAKVVSKEDSKEDSKEESKEEAKAPAEKKDPAAPPADVAASHALLSKFAASQGDGAASGVPPAHASFYGPGGCVAAYRSGEGTCVMQTRCGGQNITEYDFGLNCVDSEGETTQHLFGKNSFDPEETFDTLVKCSQCLGLNEKEAAPLKDLATHVQVLQAEMKSIQDSVKAIKDHLNPPPDTEAAPADAEGEGEGEGEEEPTGAAEETEGSLLAAEAERDAAAEKAAADDAAAEAAADDAPAEDEEPRMFLKQKHHKKKRHAKAVVRRAHVHHKKPIRHHKVAKVETVEQDEDLSMPDAPENDEDLSAPEVTADY